MYQVIVNFVLNLHIIHKSHSLFSYKFTHFVSKEKKQIRKKNRIKQMSSDSPNSKFLRIIYQGIIRNTE